MGAVKEFISEYSERIGGAAGAAGSLVLLFNGDVQSIAATTGYLTAQTALTVKGESAAVYSVSSLIFSLSSVSLAFSETVAAVPDLQNAIFFIAAVRGVVALRSAFEGVANRTEGKLKDVFQKAADHMPAVASLSIIPLGLWGGYNAYEAGEFVQVAATSLWFLSDVLIGRLPEKVKSLLPDKFKSPAPP